MSDTDTRETFTFKSVADVERAANHSGNHFFDAATMRGFKTRIMDGGRVHADRVFVTSEPYAFDGPRVYTVRIVTASPIEDGRPNHTDGWRYGIETVGSMTDSPTKVDRAYALARAVADHVRAGNVPDALDYHAGRELDAFADGFRAAKGW